ncbi:MAG: GntR family transcriptional regulator [Pseudonocardiaceae bacterium]
MNLDPAEGQLPSRRIADAVRALITSGELASGDKLPSERELARRFRVRAVTRRTVIIVSGPPAGNGWTISIDELVTVLTRAA